MLLVEGLCFSMDDDNIMFMNIQLGLYLEPRGYCERGSPISRGQVSIRNLFVPNYVPP